MSKIWKRYRDWSSYSQLPYSYITMIILIVALVLLAVGLLLLVGS